MQSLFAKAVTVPFSKDLPKKVEVAQKTGRFVWVDLVQSGDIDGVLESVRKIAKDHPFVGVMLGANLRRTAEDVLSLLNTKIPICLCEGDTKEPPSVAYLRKKERRQQFLTLAKRLLLSLNYTRLKVNDKKIIKEIEAFTKNQRIPKENFEFQKVAATFWFSG